MLTECSWLLAPEQEQPVPSTVMTEISDFQQPLTFSDLSGYWWDQMKVTLMLKGFCQILGFVVIIGIIVIFTYLYVSTIHIK